MLFRSNEGFEDKAKDLAIELARQRPSPLNKGGGKIWVAAIFHILMQINFVYDEESPYYVTLDDYVERIGIFKNTIRRKSRQIMALLEIPEFSREWVVDGNEEYVERKVLEVEEIRRVEEALEKARKEQEALEKARKEEEAKESQNKILESKNKEEQVKKPVNKNKNK